MKITNFYTIKVLAVATLFVSVALCGTSTLSAGEVRVAILGSNKRFGKEKDLISSELSKSDGIALLSRSEWTRLLREYERIHKSDGTESSLGEGFAAADALIILSQFKFKHKNYVICKLVETKKALVLDSIVIPDSKRDVEFEWLKGVAKRLKKKLAKLADGGFSNLKTVSVLNFRSESFLPAGIALERVLKVAVQMRLAQNDKILLTERENAPETLFEQTLSTEKGLRFATASTVVDGRFNINGDNITLFLRIRESGGNVLTTTLSGPVSDPAKLAEAATSTILKHLGVDNCGDRRWNARKEANEYLDESRWAFQNGLYKLSAESAEAAWALGSRDTSTAVLRIIAYANKASEGMMTSNLGIFWGARYPDVSESDAFVDAAITAISLYRIHIQSKLANLGRKERWGFFKKNFPTRFSTPFLFLSQFYSALTTPLIGYWKAGLINKDQEKTKCLRRLLSESADHIKKHEHAQRMVQLQSRGIPFWYDTPHQQMKAYIQIMHNGLGVYYLPRVIWNKMVLPKYALLGTYADKMPRFVNWNVGERKSDYRETRAKLFQAWSSDSKPEVRFFGELFQQIHEGKPDIPAIEKLLWKYIDAFSDHKFRLFQAMWQSNLSDDFKSAYLAGVLEKQCETKKINASSIEEIVIYIKKVPASRKKQLKNLADKWIALSKKNKYVLAQLRQTLYTESTVPNGALSPTKVITDFYNATFAGIHDGGLYYAYSDEGREKNSSGETVFQSHLGYLSSELKEKQCVINFKTEWNFHNSDLLDISKNYITFERGFGCIYVYDRNKRHTNKYQLFRKSDIIDIQIDGDQLWISTGATNRGFARTLQKLDMRTGRMTLIASSRRRPPENPLDGKNYDYNGVVKLSEKSFLILLRKTENWSNYVYYYDVSTCVIKPLDVLKNNEVKKYLINIFRLPLPYSRASPSYILVFKTSSSKVVSVNINSKEFNSSWSELAGQKLLGDRNLKHFSIVAETEVLSLNDGKLALLAETDINSVSTPIYLILENGGYRILPLNLKEMLSGTHNWSLYPFIGLKPNVVRNGVYLYLPYYDKTRSKYFSAVAYYSKNDIERASAKLPLIPYGRKGVKAKVAR